MLNDLTPYCFAAFRRIIWLYAASQKVEDLPLHELGYLKIFYIFARHIDLQQYPVETKKAMKKVVLVLCSKLSRDTAYQPLLKSCIDEIVKEKITVSL